STMGPHSTPSNSVKRERPTSRSGTTIPTWNSSLRLNRLRSDRRGCRVLRDGPADQLSGPERLVAPLGLEDCELAVLDVHRVLADRLRRLAEGLGADVEGLAPQARRVDLAQLAEVVG